jgi:Uma2 family endonuclease
MSIAKKEKTSYEQWLELPQEVIGEILSGELVAIPRPSPEHSKLSSTLGGELHGPFFKGQGGPGGWIFFDEPELHLSINPNLNIDIVVPDLAGWKKERLVEKPKTPYFTLAPDWVCEVLSPSTASRDRKIKMDLYAKYNIPYYWIFDPLNKTLEVFELKNSKFECFMVASGEDKVMAPPFETIQLDLSLLWW